MERQQRLSRETSEPELTIEVAHFNIEQGCCIEDTGEALEFHWLF